MRNDRYWKERNGGSSRIIYCFIVGLIIDHPVESIWGSWIPQFVMETGCIFYFACRLTRGRSEKYYAVYSNMMCVDDYIGGVGC